MGSVLFDACEEFFGTRDLYEVLKLKKDASHKDVKKAYYRLSLSLHPDRVSKEEKAHATKCFQALGMVMSVLGDQGKRKVYDETGTVRGDIQELLRKCDLLKKFWAMAHRDIPDEEIASFYRSYIGSEAEKEDFVRIYTTFKGDWSLISELCEGYRGKDDDDRLLTFAKEAVEEGKIQYYEAFFKEPKMEKEKRHKRLKEDEDEFARKTADGTYSALEEERAALRAEERRRSEIFRASLKNMGKRRKKEGGGIAEKMRRLQNN